MWPFTSSPASSSSSPPPLSTPIDPTPSNTVPSADKCPVDHTTRSAWLSANPSIEHPFHTSSSSSSTSFGSNSKTGSIEELSKERVISSIPRSSKPWEFPTNDPETTGITNGHGNGHNNNEDNNEIKKDKDGKWIYPSEQQFFNAMIRKNHNPNLKDMKTVVPIHNAVNEKAWEEILFWESKIEGSEKCGGPKLISFVGKPKERSPKAWFKTALGYTPPFDRHDWLIDRCGTQVRYVIDFYTGRSGLGDAASKMSFYLDVRPAVDNWEGIKTRAAGWWS
ncbi:uncharacterized protein I206_104395 [Kwoniella pini CBS 10737]|uniref:Holocytochrome c-type synthase n=1 Tax=Kwoniella pini CBS 10737 TaxID=1296096 RepID=A0A1B9I1U0_9TREE|nr:cytochrome c heme-lyase [Kwoniella pini CBS 10737]OCF49502.1 cytochrome c heme-lyase [Kwoniella pini CBS 10737]